MGGARQAGGRLCRVACLANDLYAKARVVAHRKRASRTVTLIAPVVFLLFLLGMWWVIVTFSGIESWRLPSPAQTWQRALTLTVGSSFWNKTLVTLGEAIAGSGPCPCRIAAGVSHLSFATCQCCGRTFPWSYAGASCYCSRTTSCLVDRLRFLVDHCTVRFSFSSRFSSLRGWVYGISILTSSRSRPVGWNQHRA